jgi:antitoxin component YwqK of YwqJK toxin-antitoxin module
VLADGEEFAHASPGGGGAGGGAGGAAGGPNAPTAPKDESANSQDASGKGPPDNGPYEYIGSSSKRHSVNFKNKELDGPVHIYDANNKLEFDGHMVQGKLCGRCRSYRNGVLTEEFEMDKDVVHGVFKQFDESGFVVTEARFVNGVKQGEMKRYSRAGVLSSVTTFENDRINGPASSYDASGEISSKFNFKLDKLHGPMKAYYSKEDGGGVLRTSNYEDGQLNGVSTMYKSSGEIQSASNYRLGQKVK